MIKLDNKKLGEVQEAIHYLKVLRDNSIMFQPEVRDAINIAINRLETYVELVPLLFDVFSRYEQTESENNPEHFM